MWIKILFALLVLVGAGLWETQTSEAAGFRNCGTTEATINAAATTLMCDDFEVNGVAVVSGHGKWYAEDCDTANSNGGKYVRTKGWCGSINRNPITPAGAEISPGANGTAFAASHDNTPGAGTCPTGCAGNEADHSFTLNGTTESKVTHLWVRYYEKWVSGYQFGAEKTLTFNDGFSGVGGIKWGDLHINCGAGSTASSGTLMWQSVAGTSGGGLNTNTCFTFMDVTSGNWYFIEVEILLSTTNSSANGLLRMWGDNCGPNGTSCSGTPTLRGTASGVNWPRGSSAEQLGSIWWQQWSNVNSNGFAYVDQVVVSSVGPIGFMGSAPDTTAPPVPTGLIITKVVR
jgi:hypothetical protein